MAYGNDPYVDMMTNLNNLTSGRADDDKYPPKTTGPTRQGGLGTRDRRPPPSPTPYEEGEYQYAAGGTEPISVEDMMSRGGGELGGQYVDEFISKLTNLSSETQGQFKDFLSGGIESKEWAQLVGLTEDESDDYSAWFGNLNPFTDLSSRIAGIEEYGKARKKQVRGAARAKAMQDAQGGGGRGGRGFARGRGSGMLSGSLKRSLLRDAMNAQMFSVNEEVGKRYGQLVASVGDQFTKAYKSLGALSADVKTEGGLELFKQPEDEIDTAIRANPPPNSAGYAGATAVKDGRNWEWNENAREWEDMGPVTNTTDEEALSD